MNKYRYGLFAVLLFGLFNFSEGKPCPERTRPHKTRCDIYYKCTELTNKHVWVPARCEEGLIYEHSLGVCVLPADDWECVMGDNKNNKKLKNQKQQPDQKPTNNRDADIYVVSNADDDEHYINGKFDDGKVEIIIGTGLRDEDGSDEKLYEGSGNGGELVELDGFMQAENRETEDILMKNERQEQEEQKQKDATHAMEKKEELEEMLQTIKTKAEIGQSSTHIDPKLTAHLQRLSQLIDGLKQNYQKPDVKQQDDHMRPDELNAFLAHFNIKNTFDPLDPNAGMQEVQIGSAADTNKPKPNKTLEYKQEIHTKLGPETKVVLNNLLPHRYGAHQQDNSNSGGGYSNSQIVVNRPEGSVLFSLPAEHHFIEHPEYSSDNSPKISEETLKTVLELSKQMIASQNVPKVIPNPNYYAPPIMQPILLTPHVDSPFSSNYFGLNPNGQSGGASDYTGAFSNGQVYNQNFKYKKPAKRPQNNNGGYGNDNNNHGNYNNGYGNENKYGNNNNNGYGNENDNNSYDNAYKNNNNNNNNGNEGYGNEKPPTTIIHNNVIPVHISSTGSGEKEMLDSYGQSLGLYPPINHLGERPDSNSEYQENTGYSSAYQNNKYSQSTTKRPSYASISTTASSSYGTTPRPYDFQPTATTINQYFTPSEHLNNHNVNHVFQSIDNYGNIPRPIKAKRPNVQIYQSSQENINNQEGYSSSNGLFPQIDSHKVHIRPNSQKFESMEMDNEELLNNYNDGANEQDYGDVNGKPQETNLQQQYSDTQYSAPSSISLYGATGLSQQPQTSLNSFNSVFSTAKNPYLPRPQSNTQNSNFYSSSSKNKYSPIASPISSSSHREGAQLVNFGGNFISFDVFQNSILPLVGGSQSGLASSLNNIEVITCTAGVRQPNTTDCTRYYVCSKKDGKVLSYSCPPYTAFNNDNRICDAKTYALCNPQSALVSKYSVTENKRIQFETLKSLQEAKRQQALQQQQQQQQAIKAQNLANLLQQYTSSSTQSQNNYHQPSQESSEQNMLNSYMQQAMSLSHSYTTTLRPYTTAPTANKKRKYYCKEGDKIPDQTSISNYFVCYKNAQGQMKGHKMSCSKNLLFCPKSTMCTLPSKCS